MDFALVRRYFIDFIEIIESKFSLYAHTHHVVRPGDAQEVFSGFVVGNRKYEEAKSIGYCAPV
jgi:hypothetical protein